MSSLLGGLSQLPMDTINRGMHGKLKDGMCNLDQLNWNRTFGIMGTSQSANPPMIGTTVDEASALVVAVQVKTSLSKLENGWAPNPEGNVVMVDVSGGSVEVREEPR